MNPESLVAQAEELRERLRRISPVLQRTDASPVEVSICALRILRAVELAAAARYRLRQDARYEAIVKQALDEAGAQIERLENLADGASVQT